MCTCGALLLNRKQTGHVIMITRGERLAQLLVDARTLSLCRHYAVVSNRAAPDSISSAEDVSRPKNCGKTSQWRVVSSVCLARFPKLIQPKTELQMQFEAVQEQLRLERSRLSDYELEEIKIKEIMEEIARKAKLDELVDDQTASAPEKFQEAAAVRNQTLTEFIPAPRTTQADREKDFHSLDRKLDHMLYLIVKRREPANTWEMPQGDHKGEESLIEVTWIYYNLMFMIFRSNKNVNSYLILDVVKKFSKFLGPCI